MNKKILLFGFLVVLLIAIPLTVWLASLQTQTNTKAAKSTNLSFAPLSGPVNVGDTINLSLLLDPGTNQISFLKLVINYNKNFLQRTSQALSIDPNYFPVTLEGPTYDQCTGDICSLSISVSIGTDVTKLIKTGGTPTPIGTVSFKALAPTTDGSTVVSFAGSTQALSLASADAPSENVLQTPSPLTLSIVGPTPTPSPEVTDTPTPTQAQSNPTPTTSTTTGGNGGTSSSTNPVCTSLTADTSSGNAPLAVNFTAAGNSNTTTISKITFNFGDTNVQDITSGGGIGSGNVNLQVGHTYQNAGTFTATATLTDANGGVSDPTSCSQTITVTAPGTTPVATSTPTQAPTGTTQGSLPKTGPGDKYIITGGIGLVGAILGGFLLFGL